MPNPSTTSLITAEQQKTLAAHLQNELLDLLKRGASPLGACQQLGIARSLLSSTLEQDPEFRRQYAEVKTTLTQNVETALYQAAMKGNVSAQKYWLELYPPPDRQLHPDTLPKLEHMSAQELLRLAEHLGIDLTLRKQK